ncbi:MAG: hypothetical protein EXR77_11875 [Myxococcales bacterium]|nr:hypothetical protein [Myxococcales bacterium]
MLLVSVPLSMVAQGCCNGDPIVTAEWVESFEGDCSTCGWTFGGDRHTVGAFHPGEHAMRLQPGASMATQFSAAGQPELSLLSQCAAGGTILVEHATRQPLCAAAGPAAVGSSGLAQVRAATDSLPADFDVEQHSLASSVWSRQTIALTLDPGGESESTQPVLLRLSNTGTAACDIDAIHYTATAFGCSGCGSR